MRTDEERRSREVSALYWESDASVAEIAQQLQLSRRALYDALTPASAGAVCPLCGGELVFATRSARASGRARCLVCGTEQEGPALRELRQQAEREPESDGRMDAPPAAMGGRAVMLVGAAVVGLAAGAVATLVFSRR